jgi:hypothetical protein
MCHLAILRHGCGHSNMLRLICRLSENDLCPASDLEVQGVYKCALRCHDCHSRDWDQRDAARVAAAAADQLYNKVEDLTDEAARAWALQRAVIFQRLEDAAAKQKATQAREIAEARAWAREHAKASWNLRYVPDRPTFYWEILMDLQRRRQWFMIEVPAIHAAVSPPPMLLLLPHLPASLAKAVRRGTKAARPSSKGGIRRAEDCLRQFRGRNVESKSGRPISRTKTRGDEPRKPLPSSPQRRSVSVTPSTPSCVVHVNHLTSCQARRKASLSMRAKLEAAQCRKKGNPMWHGNEEDADRLSTYPSLPPLLGRCWSDLSSLRAPHVSSRSA